MNAHTFQATTAKAPAGQPACPVLYGELLAFYQGERRDPHVAAEVEALVRADRRWRAHWESIRYLDLERAAAEQDAADLARFTAEHATPFCRASAETMGQVFDSLPAGAGGAGGWPERAWARHVRACVYCRRMQRRAAARRQRREGGLPAGELLLRDWLLQPLYTDALAEATRRLGCEWVPEEVGAEGPSDPGRHAPDGGETILDLGTVLDDPRGR